jgi:hypothetical protein
MRRSVITVPPYGFDLVVYTGGTWGLFHDRMRRRTPQVVQGTKRTDNYAGWVSNDAGIIVWVESGDVNTVAHEATHAAWRILQYAGVPVSCANEESLAYLVGYLTARIARLAAGPRPRRRGAEPTPPDSQRGP